MVYIGFFLFWCCGRPRFAASCFGKTSHGMRFVLNPWVRKMLEHLNPSRLEGLWEVEEGTRCVGGVFVCARCAEW